MSRELEKHPFGLLFELAKQQPEILRESFWVGLGAAIAWGPRVSASHYSLLAGGIKAESFTTTLAKQRSYFPSFNQLRPYNIFRSGKRHPKSLVWLQLSLNTFFLENADHVSKNLPLSPVMQLAIVSALAAYGASHGTRRIVNDLTMTHKPISYSRLALGLFFEALREGGYLFFCLGASKRVAEKFNSDKPDPENRLAFVAATSLVSIGGGFITGFPHTLAQIAYLESLKKINARVFLKNSFLSSTMRSVAIGTSITVNEVANQTCKTLTSS